MTDATLPWILYAVESGGQVRYLASTRPRRVRCGRFPTAILRPETELHVSRAGRCSSQTIDHRGEEAKKKKRDQASGFGEWSRKRSGLVKSGQVGGGPGVLLHGGGPLVFKSC